MNTNGLTGTASRVLIVSDYFIFKCKKVEISVSDEYPLSRFVVHPETIAVFRPAISTNCWLWRGPNYACETSWQCSNRGRKPLAMPKKSIKKKKTNYD